MQIIYFFISLSVGVLLVLLFGFLYDKIAKLFVNKPVKPVLKHPYKPLVQLVRTAEKTPLKQSFTIEVKGTKVVHELTKSNFKDLLDEFFIATEYLLELWIQHKFNLIITDKLKTHYGKDKDLNGFIRHRQIPEIYIKAKATNKFKTGILIHEISHLRVSLDAKQKNKKFESHGKEFKRHLKILFAPLLVDKTYYRKHHELSYHLTYEANRFTPTKDQCA